MVSQLTFVSSFQPRPSCLPGRSSRSQCATRSPRMTLISHEKLDDVSNSDDTNVAKYRLELEIPGAVSKQKRRESIQETKKHINIPGFRKGTIPPFMMKEMKEFVLRDCVEDMVDEATEELNLERVDDKSSQLDYDFNSLIESFTPGEDFTLSCEVHLTDLGSGSEDGDELEEIVTVDAADKGPEIQVEEAKAEFANMMKEEKNR